jgi:hypothetical protein
VSLEFRDFDPPMADDQIAAIDAAFAWLDKNKK